jgi:hypothetical protein
MWAEQVQGGVLGGYWWEWEGGEERGKRMNMAQTMYTLYTVSCENDMY